MQALKKNYEFQKTLKSGKWYGAHLLHMYISKNHKGRNYIGVAVGKKVTKSSVKRNRIRRRRKEAYRLNENKIIEGFNIIIVWKTACGVELANFSDIQQDILFCFKKANLLKEDEKKEEKDV